MLLRIEHHYSTSTLTKEDIEMAVSQAFQAQLDRLTDLVTADRSSQAVTIADAVKAQAEADQAAIAAAHADSQQALQDANDQVAALQAELDKLSTPPTPEAPVNPADVTGQPAAEAPVATPETPAGGAAPAA